MWKSSSEFGYLENYRGELRQPERHRADAGMETSRRWRGIYTPSTMQLRGRRRIDGVGRPNFDFYAGLRGTFP